jgi:hypothetical protein
MEGPVAKLADRLNPNRTAFDPDLKAAWQTMSKKAKAKLVKKDATAQSDAKKAILAIEHPFAADSDDHCETSREALRHAASLLPLVARAADKDPETLRLYDPYYCAGAVKRHMATLGFPHMHNACEDAYRVWAEKREPEYDVLMTNPPYSGSHPEKLVRYCLESGKPYLLCMPNYIATQPWFRELMVSRPPLFLCPTTRYNYWTPTGLREGKDKSKSGAKKHSGGLGVRTSPFASSWYVDLSPLVPHSALLQWWRDGGKERGFTISEAIAGDGAGRRTGVSNGATNAGGATNACAGASATGDSDGAGDDGATIDRATHSTGHERTGGDGGGNGRSSTEKTTTKKERTVGSDGVEEEQERKRSKKSKKDKTKSGEKIKKDQTNGGEENDTKRARKIEQDQGADEKARRRADKKRRRLDGGGIAVNERAPALFKEELHGSEEARVKERSRGARKAERKRKREENELFTK